MNQIKVKCSYIRYFNGVWNPEHYHESFNCEISNPMSKLYFNYKIEKQPARSITTGREANKHRKVESLKILKSSLLTSLSLCYMVGMANFTSLTIYYSDSLNIVDFMKLTFFKSLDFQKSNGLVAIKTFLMSK